MTGPDAARSMRRFYEAVLGRGDLSLERGRTDRNVRPRPLPALPVCEEES
jgi:hypothetical protein